MRSEQQLLFTTTDGASTIPSYIYENLIEATKQKLVGRNVTGLIIGPSSIPGSTVDIPVMTKNTLAISSVGEGAEILMDEAAITSSTKTPIKYGVAIRLTREVMEDSKFPLFQAQIREAGYQIARNEDTLIWTTTSAGAGTTVAGAGALTMANITNAMYNLETNDFTPTDLVVSPACANDIRLFDTFAEADKHGNREMMETGFIGKMYNMKVWQGSEQMNTGATADAFVIDKSEGLGLVEKRPMTIEEEPLPRFDSQAWYVTQRVVPFVVKANAISKITTVAGV